MASNHKEVSFGMVANPESVGLSEVSRMIVFGDGVTAWAMEDHFSKLQPQR